MTAHQGPGWRLAPSLIRLEAEANTIAPRRSMRSDGSIGDSAHASRQSDHNPSEGYVHALDLTHDPAGGFDAHMHARRIAARRDPRVKYIISNGEIWDPARGWHRYTGPSPHTAHAHFSCLHTVAAREDLSQWLLVARPDPEPEEDEDTMNILVDLNANKHWLQGGSWRTEITQQDSDAWAFIGVKRSSTADQRFIDLFHRDIQDTRAVAIAAWNSQLIVQGDCKPPHG